MASAVKTSPSFQEDLGAETVQFLLPHFGSFPVHRSHLCTLRQTHSEVTQNSISIPDEISIAEIT